MAFSRRFRWKDADDAESTHLELKKDGTYPSGNVSRALLEKLEAEGKLEFLPDPVDVELPASTILEVQNGTISLSALLIQVRAGIKEKSNG